MEGNDLKYEEPKIVAEIGCNHMGDFDIAKELILLAKQSGVGYVKFQKRCNTELLTEEQYNAPHPVLDNAYGDTYGAHREFLEFDVNQHRKLKGYCEEVGITYSTSVWDLTSAKEIASLNPEFIKVPSACNNHFEMLRYLRDHFDGQVQVSLGMTTPEETEQIVNLFEETDSAITKLMIYACTSGYPVSAEESCLLEITKLYEMYSQRVNEIGFSGHHMGISLDVAAYTLGARWIERHFTKSRAWKGTDHAASLEPQGLAKLQRDLKNTYSALRYKNVDILDIEVAQREKLKYRVK
ncbi:N-acetylneuraminate synthase family protein [Alphaproteobacteria bacterium]|nr:N-acetylneuraminate synthase family protein [Alphaproteobacteria bacterium]